jgi:hypothetical protein
VTPETKTQGIICYSFFDGHNSHRKFLAEFPWEDFGLSYHLDGDADK